MISRQYVKSKCLDYELQELWSGMYVLVDEIYGWTRSPRPYLFGNVLFVGRCCVVLLRLRSYRVDAVRSIVGRESVIRLRE
jgi:hypothetical protein